jgi:hypothetical protein
LFAYNIYRVLKWGAFQYADGIFPLGWERGEKVEVEFFGGSLKAPVMGAKAQQIQGYKVSDSQTASFALLTGLISLSHPQRPLSGLPYRRYQFTRANVTMEAPAATAICCLPFKV